MSDTSKTYLSIKQGKGYPTQAEGGTLYMDTKNSKLHIAAPDIDFTLLSVKGYPLDASVGNFSWREIKQIKNAGLASEILKHGSTIISEDRTFTYIGEDRYSDNLLFVTRMPAKTMFADNTTMYTGYRQSSCFLSIPTVLSVDNYIIPRKITTHEYTYIDGKYTWRQQSQYDKYWILDSTNTTDALLTSEYREYYGEYHWTREQKLKLGVYQPCQNLQETAGPDKEYPFFVGFWI